MNIVQESLQKLLTTDVLASLSSSEYLEIKSNIEIIIENTVTQYLATELSNDELTLLSESLNREDLASMLHFFDKHPAHKIALYSRIEDSLSNIL